MWNAPKEWETGTKTGFIKLDGPKDLVFVGEPVFGLAEFKEGKYTRSKNSKDKRFAINVYNVAEKEIMILSGGRRMYEAIKKTQMNIEGMGKKVDEVIVRISKKGAGVSTEYDVSVTGQVDSALLDNIKKMEKSELAFEWVDGQQRIEYSKEDEMPF